LIFFFKVKLEPERLFGKPSTPTPRSVVDNHALAVCAVLLPNSPTVRCYTGRASWIC
jgi:hypothetical protein